MGIQQNHSSPLHWRYLLSLEEDLHQIARFIEPAPENLSAYSSELASMLLAAGSEVDVLAKMICQKVKKESKAKNIGHYASTIGTAYPSVGNFRVEIPKFGLKLHPWENWAKSPRTSPLWWKAYNQVKHERNAHFNQANLKNTLNALAGLYVLVLHLYRDMARAGRLSPNPTLFRPAGVDYNTIVWDTEFLIQYDRQLT
jgi:hypothetical protein